MRERSTATRGHSSPLRFLDEVCQHGAMSSLRLFAVPVCALLMSTACGRTEAVFQASGADTGGDTWSYEDTATPIDDIPGWETVADESGTDDWMTGDWGEDAPETWGESTDVDTFDTFDSTDFDTTIDTTADTTDITTDTNTDTTDTATTDTNTDTTDTATTDTNTDTTDTATTDTNTDTTDTATTDTNTDTTDTATTDTTDTTDTSTTDTGGDTCADAAACLVDCGGFSGMCINDCTGTLPANEQDDLYDLQICAIQSCFFLGECQLGDFNSPECIQCRLDVNIDPMSMGCGPEGAVCGI
jgi:hypothetical protein